MSRRSSGGFMQTVSKEQLASPENEAFITRYEKGRSQADKAAYDRSAHKFVLANKLSLKQWDRMSHKYRRMYDEGKAPRSRGSFLNEPDKGSDLEYDDDSSPETDDVNQSEDFESNDQDLLRHESDDDRSPLPATQSASISRPSRQGFTYSRLSPLMQFQLSQYWFTISRKPLPQERNKLWKHLKKLDDEITETQITRWFENRRAAEKRQNSGKQ